LTVKIECIVLFITKQDIHLYISEIQIILDYRPKVVYAMCKERSADTKEEINPGKESNTVNTTSDIERYCTIQESITQSYDLRVEIFQPFDGLDKRMKIIYIMRVYS